MQQVPGENPYAAYGEANAPLAPANSRDQALFTIARKLLRGTVSWRVYSIITSIAALGAVVAFISILDGDKETRLLWAGIYLFMTICAIWQSVQIRDFTKKQTFEKHGQNIPDIVKAASSIGNIKLRIAAACVGLILSVGFFVAGLSMSSFSGEMVFNALVVGFLVYVATFQQTFVAHNRADSEFLKTCSAPPHQVANQNAGYQQVGPNRV